MTKSKEHSLNKGALGGSHSSCPAVESLPLRAFKTELDPNNKQVSQLRRWCEDSDAIFNLGLDILIGEYKETGKSTGIKAKGNGLYARINDLAVKDSMTWVKSVPSRIKIWAIDDIENARQRFFKANKSGKKSGFPKHKFPAYNWVKKTRKDKTETRRLKQPRQTLSFTTAGSIRSDGNHIKIPVMKMPIRLKERNYIPVDCKVKHITISNDGKKWYVSALVEVPSLKRESGDEIIGIDVGLLNRVALSNGRIHDLPRPLREQINKMRKLQRQRAGSGRTEVATFSKDKNRAYCKRTKGSYRWNKYNDRINKLHREIKQKRDYTIHSLTDYLVRTYGGIIVEDLSIVGMMRSKRYAYHIADVAWGEIFRQLEYKCKQAGIVFAKIDRFYASTKTCSQCGYKKDEMPENIRVFECPVCGLILDRDINAARNVLHQYLRSCGPEVMDVEDEHITLPRKRHPVKRQAGIATCV